MAPSPFSRLLLLRRLRLIPAVNPRLAVGARSISSSSPDSTPQSSLSARMSFVFDQIDALEKERSEKDETLQRIRAWKEAKKVPPPPPPIPPGIGSEVSGDTEAAESSAEPAEAESSLGFETSGEVELVHPWPEWIDLMERLVQQNYFDHRRKDEDKMIEDVGFFAASSMGSRGGGGDCSGLDFKNLRLVQTACLNFGKDRFDIFRSMLRKDIQTLVGFGCPSSDKKVVFSSKLLRKYVHLDEGDVCSSCSLRSSCDRAYLVTLKEDEARFIDIMRVLLAYGFDPLNEAALNPTPMKQKSIKTVVRKMLHHVVKLSSVPIDPNLPPPIIKKPPPKVKQAPPPPRKRIGRDDIEMKKGDWLCPKCDFMNFAKNNVCLQCDAKRPKRQLLPGEWECPQCNFLNYRRNLVCFHCECKRPPDEYTGNKMQEKLQGPRMSVDNKMNNRSEVSSAWNFDFDDDESDGADVAAFEYADSSIMEKVPSDKTAQGGRFERPEFDYNKASRDVRDHRSEYSDDDNTLKPGLGFDDFDDEDDVDSYEIDTDNKSSVQVIPSNDFSKFEGNSQSKPVHRRSFSKSDDDLDLDSDGEVSPKTDSRRGTKAPFNKQSKVMGKGRRAFSDSEDDELDSDPDNELSSNPKRKSSHVAASRPRGRGSKGPSKGLSYGSDDELGMYSDVDDEVDRNHVSNRDSRSGSSRMRDSFSGSESENEGKRSYGNKLRGNAGPSRSGRDFNGRGSFNSSDSKFKSNGPKNRMKSFDDDDDSDDNDFDRSSQWSRGRGFRGNNNEPRANDRKGGARNFKECRRNSSEDDDDEDDDNFGRFSQGSRGGGKSSGPRMTDRKGGARSFDEPRGGGFGKRQGGRRNDDDDDDDFGRFSQGSRGGGFGGKNRGGARSFEEPRRGGFGKRQGGRRNDDYERDSKSRGSQEFKNSRRVIER